MFIGEKVAISKHVLLLQFFFITVKFWVILTLIFEANPVLL